MVEKITVTIEKEKPAKSQGEKTTKKPTGRPLDCAYCEGTGRVPPFGARCPVCNGMGRVPPEIGKKKCRYCNNTGRAGPIGPQGHNKCPVCHGWGYIK